MSGVRTMEALAAPLLLAALCALAGGCGGGGEPTATSAGAGTSAGGGSGGDVGARNGTSGGSGAAPGSPQPDADDGSEGAAADLDVDPDSIRRARVTSTGAVQTLPPTAADHETAQRNSYASIRSFGEESQGAEATAISFALVQYLDARARGEWATACARLQGLLARNLVRLARQQGGEAVGCPAAYGRLVGRAPARVRAEQARIDVSSIRREGDKAFVVYKTPATLSADMPMVFEDGVWKVGALEAYALTPDQAG